MIAIEELKELVKTIIYTGYIKEEKPLSCMFVADKGSGKSETLGQFKKFENLAFFTDITYIGLLELLQQEKDLTHIIIPDFLKITMKPRSTSQNIISCLNAVIEEGLNDINLMTKRYNFNSRKVGLLTATTSESFFKYQKQWDNMGFVSRLLVISYSYSSKTKEEIFDYIFHRKYLKEKIIKEGLPKKKVKIKMSSEFAKMLRDVETDFRKQKQLQVLSMARALINRRKEVIKKDIDEVISMKKFINLLFYPI